MVEKTEISGKKTEIGENKSGIRRKNTEEGEQESAQKKKELERKNMIDTVLNALLILRCSSILGFKHKVFKPECTS